MTTHPVLSEQLIYPFCFYCGSRNNVVSGMRFQNKLYGLVYQFGLDQRWEAFSMAQQLAIKDNSLLVTVSATTYKVWISLSSQEYPYWQQATTSSGEQYQPMVQVA